MGPQSLHRAILIGGLLGGALDLLFAISFASYNGIAPSRVFQAIASGVLGDTAFGSGTGVAVFGMACHFALSVLWAGCFAAVAWQFPALPRRPLLSGIAFGIVVFLCMRLVVLPLSAYPRQVTFKPLATTLDLLSHTLLFGLPIAVAVSRSLRARWAHSSFKAKPLRSSP